jgi:hypothetical protein
MMSAYEPRRLSLESLRIGAVGLGYMGLLRVVERRKRLDPFSFNISPIGAVEFMGGNGFNGAHLW